MALQLIDKSSFRELSPHARSRWQKRTLCFINGLKYISLYILLVFTAFVFAFAFAKAAAKKAFSDKQNLFKLIFLALEFEMAKSFVVWRSFAAEEGSFFEIKDKAHLSP